MDNIIVSGNELKLLKQHKRRLEYHFGVRINLPEVSNSNCSNDVIVVSVCGETIKRNYVKSFLEREMNKFSQKQAQRSTTENNIPVITLSESDSDNTVLSETQNKSKTPRRKRRGRRRKKQFNCHLPLIDFSPSKQENNNVCQVASNLSDPTVKERSLPSTVECQSAVNIPNNTTTEDMDDSVVILSDDINTQNKYPLIDTAQNLPAEKNSDAANTTTVTDDSIIILSDDIHMPSTSNYRNDTQKESIPVSSDDNVIDLSKDTCFPPTPEFLHLRTSKYSKKRGNEKRKEDLMILPNPIPQPIAKARRVLRPIVIDGSNVAREHGKIQNTFSCKGIQISIQYFLERGHTQVTALLPHFRKYCRNSFIPTTDQHILDELERTQHVVFTPSRRVNGRMVACYDDRFIVELASTNGGVILSNDNYRDIMDEKPQFKKTIEERLLMYCFVGDTLMCPDDPLGRYGPRLDEFLSMKESNSETHSISSHAIQMPQDKVHEIDRIPR